MVFMAFLVAGFGKRMARSVHGWVQGQAAPARGGWQGFVLGFVWRGTGSSGDSEGTEQIPAASCESIKRRLSPFRRVVEMIV
jgi:hypothetical protein